MNLKKQDAMNKKILHKFRSDFLPPFLVFLLFISLWEIAVIVFQIPEYLFSSPSQILKFSIENFQEILKDFGLTMYESILGFIIGSVFKSC